MAAKQKLAVPDKQFVFNSDNIEDIIDKQSQGFALPRYMNPWFKNQIGVRKAGVVYGWTQHEVDEFTKCALDIHHFANTYCKIKSEDGQVRQMKLRDYQYKVLDTYTKNRFTLNMSSRQTGKTICAAISLLHYCIFNTNKGVMIVANKGDTVVEILDKIKNIYKQLPFFLKPGIVNWNSKAIVFDNGCRIKSQARSKEPAIGFTIDYLYMDEFAHIPRNIINHYYKAAIPTVSSIKGSKIVITSTPNGANLFKDLVMGAQLPEGHPDKNMYKLIKVYWHQVPDGKFEDGSSGTRMDAKLYPSVFEMRNHEVTLHEVYQELKSFGFKVAKESEQTENGDKQLIRILHEPDKTDIEIIRTLKIRGDIPIVQLMNITNWKEQEVKLIGGEEAFNQEYNIQFIAGSKRVLSVKKAKELEDRCTKYTNVEIDSFKRLRFKTPEFRWHPEFQPSPEMLGQYYWMTSTDVSEGLELDDSVINGFRLMVRSPEWLKEHKVKSLYDAFYMKQTFIYHTNFLDPKKELPELFYLLHFEVLDPERVKAVVEYNGPGSSMLAALPGVFESNNDYATHMMVRYKHNKENKKRKIGLKVTKNKKEFVKAYIGCVDTDKLYIDEEMTLGQVENFITVPTPSGDITYKADSGHDDVVMTCVDGCTFFDTQEYKNMCHSYYEELPYEIQHLIDGAIDLEYNPNGVSYKALSGILAKNKGNGVRANRFGGGQRRHR